MSNERTMPWCHDAKLKVEEGDKTIQSKNIAAALEVADTIDNEHITISVRKKDKNGLWYFGVVVVPFSHLESGDIIKIGVADDKISKIVLM